MPHGLRRINHKYQIAASGDGPKFLNRLDRTINIGAMDNNDQPGGWNNGIFYVASRNGPGLRNRKVTDFNTLLLQFLQGTGNGIMLKAAGDDMVARFKQPFQSDVDRIGTIQREDDSFDFGSPDKAGNQGAGFLNHSHGSDGKAVAAVAGVAALFSEELVHSPVDAFRLGPGG